MGVVSDLAPQHRAGKVRVLATSGAKRARDLPDVPTFRELGYAIEGAGWYAAYAPAETPKDTIDRLAAAIVEAIRVARRAPEARGDGPGAHRHRCRGARAHPSRRLRQVGPGDQGLRLQARQLEHPLRLDEGEAGVLVSAAAEARCRRTASSPGRTPTAATSTSRSSPTQPEGHLRQAAAAQAHPVAVDGRREHRRRPRPAARRAGGAPDRSGHGRRDGRDGASRTCSTGTGISGLLPPLPAGEEVEAPPPVPARRTAPSASSASANWAADAAQSCARSASTSPAGAAGRSSSRACTARPTSDEILQMQRRGRLPAAAHAADAWGI